MAPPRPTAGGWPRGEVARGHGRADRCCPGGGLDGSRLDLEEDAREVVVTVYAWQNAGSCDDLGVPYTLTGTLDALPGDRVVVDGACRLDEYRDRDTCRPR